MKSNDIEQLNIPDGELIYTKNKTKAPLSKNIYSHHFLFFSKTILEW